MGIYFGTDGIRGIACRDLSTDTAEKLGNSLGQKKRCAKIIIGRDTRISGSLLTSAFAVGAMKAGANVIDVGIVTTPCVALLVKRFNADYGVMVSASHNPPEYNGLKVFGCDGKKLSEKEEEELEELFSSPLVCPKLGQLSYLTNGVKIYEKHLESVTRLDFKGMKIALDCSNGASYKIAKKVFKNLGSVVFTTGVSGNGEKINEGCGSLHIENLQHLMKTSGADVGFAFDGDADRIIAVASDLTVFDGDKLIYILAKHLKSKGELKNNTVVGTSHTNSGICHALEKNKINMIRTDIGDKYVIEAMENMNLSLGGEQSGHIILSSYASTGDGVLAAIKLSEIIKESGKSLNELFDAKLYPQENRTYRTNDKLRIINNEILSQEIKNIQNKLPLSARILVRASGTEPKIRVMVETTSENDAIKYADELISVMKKIDNH